MKRYTVGYIVGSISEHSINHRLARALAKLSPEAGLDFEEVPIAGLPMFNRDYETTERAAEYPTVAAEFKAAIARRDAVVIVTPEYNRSMPGVLKNALDWASRPNGEGPFTGKPSAVVGASIGAVGTAIAQQHVRAVLSFLASPGLTQPEVYLQLDAGLIDDRDAITSTSTEAFLRGWLAALYGHIAATLVPRPVSRFHADEQDAALIDDAVA